MKKILATGVILILIILGFGGCLTEETAPLIAQEMEEAYSAISSYRAHVNFTSYMGFSKEYIKTIEKPDKSREEYLSPEFKSGDLLILNGHVMWRYDKSKNKANQDTHDINIGGETLATPDFLNWLLALMDVADVNQLEDENVNGYNTYVIEIIPKTQTTFSKYIYWLEKETYFPIKRTQYDSYGDIQFSELIEEFEINIDIQDSYFEVPTDAEIITLEDWIRPKTIEECEDAVGFTILLPTYLPEGYAINEEYLIGAGQTSISDDGIITTITTKDFQNRIMRQGVDLEETVTISFPHNDSYINIINGTTGEVLATFNTSTGQIPILWDHYHMSFEKNTKDITLRESLENIFEGEFLPKKNAKKVGINDIKGEYWIHEETGQYGEVISSIACLSWNLNEYWLMLRTVGDAILDSDEMVLIAESIQP